MLSMEEFKKFCGETGYLEKKSRNKSGYTIDRIDSSKGYLIDNIQILTFSQNSAKGNRDEAPF